MGSGRHDFWLGALIGALLTGCALLLSESDAAVRMPLGWPESQWIAVNLGHSSWLFAVVLALYVVNLAKLHRLLRAEPGALQVVQLDQLTDVWIHLFVGIGVIWTAVGMRSALQAALGDPGDALTDTAGNVLRKLVDGGILLALTTTIVGAVGGYLMRLGKTLLVGTLLQSVYERSGDLQMRELITATNRIEAQLAGSAPSAERTTERLHAH